MTAETIAKARAREEARALDAQIAREIRERKRQESANLRQQWIDHHLHVAENLLATASGLAEEHFSKARRLGWDLEESSS